MNGKNEPLATSMRRDPMTEAGIRSIAERKIEGALTDRMQKFGYGLADLHSQFVKTGGAGGSGHQQVIRDACKSELRDRFQAVGGMLRSIAINFSLPRSSTTAEELKALMRQLVINSTSDLREAIELTKGGSGAADGRADVTALIEQVLPEAEADIDLFISAATVKIDPTLLRQMQNTVTDLRNTDQPSFERHIRKLARLLHSPGISEITAALTKNTDLNAWFKASGADTSGLLAWPTDRNEEFGIIIKLIDKCAEQPDWATSWLAFKIYGVGKDHSRNLQNLASKFLCPSAVTTSSI
jgi:hypothetical protein